MFESLKLWVSGIFAPSEFIGSGSILKEINTLEDLDEVIATSDDHPVLIFKHSTRCPVSFGANARVGHFIEECRNEDGDLPEIHIVKVVEHRDVSNAIADRLSVEHQSPQMILLDKGNATWNASHHNITPEAIQSALEEVTA